MEQEYESLEMVMVSNSQHSELLLGNEENGKVLGLIEVKRNKIFIILSQERPKNESLTVRTRMGDFQRIIGCGGIEIYGGGSKDP